MGVDEGGWFTRDGRGAHGVGLWKDIRKELALLKDNSSYVVGNGRRVRFWEDIWCGSEPLCRTYPTLYSMAASKRAVVAEIWDQHGEAAGWNPCF